MLSYPRSNIRGAYFAPLPESTQNSIAAYPTAPKNCDKIHHTLIHPASYGCELAVHPACNSWLDFPATVVNQLTGLCSVVGWRCLASLHLQIYMKIRRYCLQLWLGWIFVYKPCLTVVNCARCRVKECGPDRSHGTFCCCCCNQLVQLLLPWTGRMLKQNRYSSVCCLWEVVGRDTGHGD